MLLGDGAFAATKLKKNGVSSKQVKNGQAKTKDLADNAVSTPKVPDGSLLRGDFAAGPLTTIRRCSTGSRVSRRRCRHSRPRFASLGAEMRAQESTVSDQEAVLAGVSRETVDGNDTLRFSDMNVQIVNGRDATTTSDGLGNLIIGSDEQTLGPPATRTGSHYLVVGDQHEWTSFGGIVVGYQNDALGQWASVSGGRGNTVTGDYSSASGRFGNVSSGDATSGLEPVTP